MSENIDWKAKFEEGQAERQAFEEHYKNAVIRIQVEAEARTVGMTDPDLAIKLVDTSHIFLDTESNNIHGVREALEELAARKPYLFGPKVKQGVPPPKRFGNDGFLEAVQREVGFKKS